MFMIPTGKHLTENKKMHSNKRWRNKKKCQRYYIEIYFYLKNSPLIASPSIGISLFFFIGSLDLVGIIFFFNAHLKLL